MIICLSGLKRSGKDSAAEVMTSRYRFTKIALADPIRELCSEVFDIPLSVFVDDTLKEQEFTRPIRLNEAYLGHIISLVEENWGFEVSESAKEGMSKHLGAELIHPRRILQTIGTEVIRDNVDKDIFLKLADKRIQKATKDVVISDVRFSNEREWFKKKNATLCLVIRPSTKGLDAHSSEMEMGNPEDYDVVMTNDSTLNRFQMEVGEWINTKMNRSSY